MRLFFVLLFILPMQASTIVESARKVRPPEILSETVDGDRSLQSRIGQKMKPFSVQIEEVTLPEDEIVNDMWWDKPVKPVKLTFSKEVGSSAELSQFFRIIKGHEKSAYYYIPTFKYTLQQERAIELAYAWCGDHDMRVWIKKLCREKSSKLKDMGIEDVFRIFYDKDLMGAYKILTILS